MAITIGNGTISGLSTGGLPDNTVTGADIASSTIGAGNLSRFGGVVGVGTVLYDARGHNGNGHHGIATCNISPTVSTSDVLTYTNLTVAWVPGHAGEGRFVKSLNGGGYQTFELPSQNNRSPNHGSEEGVPSDGGAGFMVMTYDRNPGTTGNVAYQLQTRAESGGLYYIGAGMHNSPDQNPAGYPGTARGWIISMEFKV
jgi:hypothetical protein